ncbi:hypothetical protein K504DRAFT_453895 [Pleomassaria siparia CBS 279.74]|uniref:Uncharacterized protein n=1 Tax=Pleomassaria siparia CBS 279.74 TaxID=1314801 RepID=A0A6G1KDE5_9PLEO|nr:hypothetical protein K504DRAFT_453895 [Pleomassaria siparia CBS 279.74]
MFLLVILSFYYLCSRVKGFAIYLAATLVALLGYSRTYTLYCGNSVFLRSLVRSVKYPAVLRNAPFTAYATAKDLTACRVSVYALDLLLIRGYLRPCRVGITVVSRN